MLRSAFAASLLAACSVTAFAQPAANEAADPNQELIQVSTINALIKGVLEGDTTVGEIKKGDSFGIGTLNQLDGEMLTLDGQTYQIKGNGKVNPVPDSTKTPFASMTSFKADSTLEGQYAPSFKAMQDQIDASLPSENLFYAVKVTGTFPKMKVRSVDKQTPPYRPLTEIVNEQSIFEFENISGTLVGFRCPEYVQGVNVAGYHMHFLSDDKTRGGHVLDFELKDGTIGIDRLSNFRMILSRNQDFMKAELADKNEAAIHKVEKLMGDPATSSTQQQ